MRTCATVCVQRTENHFDPTMWVLGWVVRLGGRHFHLLAIFLDPYITSVLEKTMMRLDVEAHTFNVEAGAGGSLNMRPGWFTE